jgi:hypothetical protein
LVKTTKDSQQPRNISNKFQRAGRHWYRRQQKRNRINQ